MDLTHLTAEEQDKLAAIILIMGCDTLDEALYKVLGLLGRANREPADKQAILLAKEMRPELRRCLRGVLERVTSNQGWNEAYDWAGWERQRDGTWVWPERRPKLGNKWGKGF